MNKIVLFLFAILNILLVIIFVFVINDDPLPVVVCAVGLLSGILLSLITLIPAIHKRAQSNLAVRVVTLLVVMILSAVVLFFTTKRLEVEFHYRFVVSIGIVGFAEYHPDYYHYQENSRAIRHETWIRVMAPPLLRRQCYTTEKDVCEFVDQFPKNRELMSRNYLQGVALALALSLPGGAFVWYFTRRKQSPEVVIEIAELVLIALFTVLFVIFVASIGLPGAGGLLSGILLSLLTLIPAVRKRAQNNLAGRVVTLLGVMILSVVVLFSVITWLEIQVFHYYASIYSSLMSSREEYETYWEFYDKYEEKDEAIVHETWLRVMAPPLLREQCYTIEKDVCEFVDQFPKNRELMSQNYLGGAFAFALGFSLPGGVLAWYFTRRKQSPEVVIEDSDEKK